jgi:hypothetical protein
MIEELMIGAGTAAAVGFTYARRRRVSLYRDLEGHLAGVVADRAPDLTGLAQRELPHFDDRFATLPDVLPAQTFTALKAEAERLVAPERSFVPTHKKGGTVAYETLITSAPAIAALYHSKGFRDFISRLVGGRPHRLALRPQLLPRPAFYRAAHDGQYGTRGGRTEPRGNEGAGRRGGCPARYPA